SNIESDNALLKDLLKSLIASQETLRATLTLANQPKKAIEDLAIQNKPTADEALNTLKGIPDSSLGRELKQRIVECITAVNGASADAMSKLQANASANPEEVIKACSDDKLRSILNDLNKKKADTLAKWESCRQTVVDSGVLSSQNLP